MALKNLFKLEKLTIYAYQDSKRKKGEKTFEVMFNPTSFSTKYENVLQKNPGINTSGRSAKYARSQSESLSLKLILDGTGVAGFGLSMLGAKTVKEQIDDFLELCFYMDGKIHEPKYLKIEWGILNGFECRLESVEIDYTSFDKGGMPLRAELKVVFVEDVDPEKRVKEEGKSSPDLTHTRIVKSGDTLPLLTRDIYGSSAYYVRVAQPNALDDFRNLTPGQTLFFPPLEK